MVLHALVHFPSALNSQNWARMRSGEPGVLPGSPPGVMGVTGTHVLSHPLPPSGGVSRELGVKKRWALVPGTRTQAVADPRGGITHGATPLLRGPWTCSGMF